MKVAILGSTGFAGQILLRILLKHPEVEEIYPVSNSKAGMSIYHNDKGISPQAAEKLIPVGHRYLSMDELVKQQKPDLLFAALPHLKSGKIASTLFESTVVIDLSADFRIPDKDLFASAYGQAPPRPDLLSRAVYGLSEWKAAEIRGADLIANPGCYPTATLLPLLPLLEKGLLVGQIIVNAMSGISGAGRKAQEHLLYTSRTENITAYLPGRSHRHWQEMNWHLAHISGKNNFSLFFTPHLVPVHHGMAVTTVAHIKKDSTGSGGEHSSDEHIENIFSQYYGNSPFVNLCTHIPESSHVRNTNRCDFTWRREGDQLFLLSVIDNLYKGASGQAVQNMNIRFGFDEQTGLQFHGEI